MLLGQSDGGIFLRWGSLLPGDTRLTHKQKQNNKPNFIAELLYNGGKAKPLLGTFSHQNKNPAP